MKYSHIIWDFNGTILFTSQDHEFIQTVADRIVEISPNGWINAYDKYDDYLVNPEYQKRKQMLYKCPYLSLLKRCINDYMNRYYVYNRRKNCWIINFCMIKYMWGD